MSTRAFLLLVVAAAATACGSASSPGALTTPTPAPSSATPTPTPTPTRSTAAPLPTATATSTRPTASPTATTALPGWLAGRVVTRLPTTRKVVALTFDGGAGAQGARSVLATLAAQHVPATFFLTGQFVADNPAVVAAIPAGDVVGNHTMTHPHLPTLSTAGATREVTTAGQRIGAAIGHSPRPWFRFPYGEYDARTLQLVNSLGYGAIGWTIDSRGWLGRSAGSAADIVTRVRAALRPGAIVLMHLGANPDDGTTYDADALPGVIAAARAAGYSFVTVAG